MEKTLKRQIIKSADAVKKKVKIMRDLETDSEKFFETVLKPITDPLSQMTNCVPIPSMESKPSVSTLKNTVKRFDYTNDKIKNQPDSDEFNSLSSFTNLDDYANNSSNKNDNLDNEQSSNSGESESSQETASETSFKSPRDSSVSLWSLSSETFQKVPYGVEMNHGKLVIGKSTVSISDDTIKIADHTYPKTDGLVELLFKKVPDISLITEEDKKSYKEILLLTNVHRRGYDANKPIKSNKGLKYLEIIKPLFTSEKRARSNSLTYGKGLPLMKKMKSHTDYVYWDDPNELVERLKLLIASRDAGNTGLGNEIISIIEELRESGIIN